MANYVLPQKSRCSVGSRPDYLAIATILKSCASNADIKWGKTLHSYVLKLGHASCRLVSKALLNMYGKCNALDDCQRLFNQIGHCDVVMWNIVLSGFAWSRNHDTEAMRLFHTMHMTMDPKPSSITIATILPVCARSGTASAGKTVHSYVIKSGLVSQTLVGNSLVSMYSKSGRARDYAYEMFEEMPARDVVSWNAMIAGFSENNFIDEAFKLFSWMLKGPVAPNYATIASILPVCGLLEENVAYHFGKKIHCHVLRRAELEADVSVNNALVSFYSRIGRMEEAESVFRRMKVKDLVSWNTIISGYTSNSQWWRALFLFLEFLSEEGIGLDSVTLLSILPACAHLCNLQLGKQIHGYIIQHPWLNKDTSVGNALLSFYRKCGDLDASFRTFLSIYKRDLISWNAMLDAFAEGQLESQFINLLHWMLEETIRPDYITILTAIQFFLPFQKSTRLKRLMDFPSNLIFW
ncbi:hypothetical protein NMG60_11019116 [Bertholletia excelsa]